jgi:hypothetical protein
MNTIITQDSCGYGARGNATRRPYYLLAEAMAAA